MSNQAQVFTLKRVTEIIQAKIELQFPSSFWVKAEINKVGYNPYSKHAYPELVEKQAGKIVAQMSATLFSKTYENVNRRFLEVLKEPLKEGINALLYVKIQYNPMYGLSLNIIDIDPSYTLGDLERERLETIEKLKAEGVFTLNKQLKLPLLMNRLAVISGEGTQGFSDFMSVLNNNPYGYSFYTHVFSAVMQGDAAVDSILRQLKRIKKVLKHFDAVLIIRGGGGNVGMTCYNNYQLSREIALFPLPVFTGIGHSTNEFVADLVANMKSITPTEIATKIVNHTKNVDEPLAYARQILSEEVAERLKLEDQELRKHAKSLQMITQLTLQRFAEDHRNTAQRLLLKTNKYLSIAGMEQNDLKAKIKSSVQKHIFNQHHQISKLQQNLKYMNKNRFNVWQLQLNNLSETIRLLDPKQLIKRGYSITQNSEGTVIKSIDQLKKGEILITQVNDGSIKSIVQ